MGLEPPFSWILPERAVAAVLTGAKREPVSSVERPGYGDGSESLLLEARREAEELALEERERPLCSNACLLSRALETQDGEAVFASGRQVLSGLRIEEIAALADTWSRFNQAENPSLTMDQEQAERLKKN